MICLPIYSIKSDYLCDKEIWIFMENTRQQKISRLLQKELGEIFLLYAKDIKGTLISVTNVRISPDLSIARIYLSIFPSKDAETILKNIQEIGVDLPHRAWTFVFLITKAEHLEAGK